jgi:hypothetical protein
MTEEGSCHRDLKHLLLLEAKKILLSNQLDSSFESSVRHRISLLEQEVWALSISAGGTSDFHSIADSILADVDDELNDLLDHYRAANWNHMRQPADASSCGNLRYTVPKALQYRIKLRDTKMNGMSMYENEAHHHPPAAVAASASNKTSAIAIDTSSTTSSSKALKGSRDRAGDMKSFLDSSPSLTHSLHDLAQVMEQSRRGGDGSVEAALETEGGIEFCIVEADWSRLQSAGRVGPQSMSMLTPLLPPRRSWRYPASLLDGREVNNTQELQDQSFFFPSGVKVDVLGYAVAGQRCRASQHMRHIVPFTDAHGRPTYACVLTVTQRYEQDDIALYGDMVMPNLVRITQQKQAAMCIQKCFRLFIARRKAQVWQMMRRPTAVASPPETGTRGPSSLFQRRLSDLSLLSDSTHGGGTPSKVVHPNNNYQGNNNNNNPVPGRRTFLSLFNRSSSSSNSSSTTTAINSPGSTVSSPSGPSGLLPKTPSPAAAADRRDSIKSSDRQARATAAKQRYSLERANVSGYLRSKVIVAQKAYCIISVSQQYTFIFKVLDAIAAAEASLVMPVEVCLRNRFLELVESFLLAHLVDRQVWGMPLYRLARSVGSKQATIKKSPRRSSSSSLLSSSSMSPDHNHDDHHVGNDDRSHKRRVVQHIRVSGYIADFPICVSSLLSTQEWTAAVLFTHLSSQIVCKIINLLLMEKSLIIHGKNAGIVTSITMAVLHLIEPFCWEGIFVPLVPGEIPT